MTDRIDQGRGARVGLLGRLRGSDAGSFAILYGLILFLLIGFAALVLDLGALRAERRAAQTTADFASTAGAMQLLSHFGGSPEQACREALRFVDANIADTRFSLTEAEINDFCQEDPSDPDHGFPDSDSECFAADHEPDPEAAFPELERRLVQGAYVITLTWPVDFDDEDYTNGYSEEVDGHRCERFSVQADVTRGFILAGGLGWLDEGTTGAPAVARAEAVQRDDIVAALVVLDLHDCWALRGGGSGDSAFHIFEAELPDGEKGMGVIAIDSDGTGSSCASNNRTIDIDGSNVEILAGVVDDDGDGFPDTHPETGDTLVRKGAIFSYALTPDGNPDHAYDLADVAAKQLAGGDRDPPLPGDPPIRPPDDKRVERQRWYHRYDCRDDYSDPRYAVHAHEAIEPCEGRTDDEGNVTVPVDSAYVSRFRARIQEIAGDIATADDPEAAAAAAGFTYVTGSPRCDLTAFEGGPKSGDYWFDCELEMGVGGGDPEVEIDGNVVVMGNVKLNGGKLSVRAAPSSEDGWMYIDQQFTKAGGASLVLGRSCSDPDGDTCEDGNSAAGVALIMAQGPDDSRGSIDLSGGAGEAFTWVAPYRPGTFLSGGSETYNFEDLGLWTEYTRLTTQPLIMSGDVSNLVVDGIYFMPNAWFSFRGQGEMRQQRAQFIAYRADARGQGALRMSPDPSRAEPLFSNAVVLIR